MDINGRPPQDSDPLQPPQGAPPASPDGPGQTPPSPYLPPPGPPPGYQPPQYQQPQYPAPAGAPGPGGHTVVYGPPVPGAVVVDGTVWLPAGFMPRLLAFLLDWALLGLLHLIIVTLIGIPQPDQEEAMKISMKVMEQAFSGGPDAQLMREMDKVMGPANLSYGVLIATCASYYIIFYTLLGATVGKLVLGLRVLRRNGKPISAGTAAVRYLVYYLTGWLAYTGWATLFTAEKRTLHDIASDTNVFKAVSIE